MRNGKRFISHNDAGGTLEAYIAKRATSPAAQFDEPTILFMFCQVLLGLQHVHSFNILHRDLKTNK